MNKETFAIMEWTEGWNGDYAWTESARLAASRKELDRILNRLKLKQPATDFKIWRIELIEYSSVNIKHKEDKMNGKLEQPKPMLDLCCCVKLMPLDDYMRDGKFVLVVPHRIGDFTEVWVFDRQCPNCTYGVTKDAKIK